VEAILSAGEATEGATLYVTLEPCNHHGRTPPCTEAILRAGISNVVFAIDDPNEGVLGGGADFLRLAGLDVQGGTLACEATYVNRFFLHHARTRRPWVITKFASSLDGKIATRSGESKWITGLESRARAHRLRAMVDAIAVGTGTVLADDPKLTVKEKYVPMPRQPIRIVLDSKCRTPKNAEVLSGAAPTLIIITEQCKKDFPNAEEITCGKEKVDLHRLMGILDQRGIRRLLVEGGEGVIWSFINEGLADEIYIFMGSMIIGGDISPTPAGGEGSASEDDIIPLTLRDVKRIGDGVLVHYEVNK